MAGFRGTGKRDRRSRAAATDSDPTSHGCTLFVLCSQYVLFGGGGVLS
jgi:hypothetical protein